MPQVIEIAVAGAESQEVEVVSLEAADVSTRAVGALTQIVAELVENAAAFSQPGQRVRINGVFDGRDYLLTISDQGVGVSEAMLGALNRVLSNPASSGDIANTGISSVARLAARAGIDVELVPGMPGSTARVIVPESSVSDTSASRSVVEAPVPPTAEARATIDLSRIEREMSSHVEHVVEVADPTRGDDVEDFLEKIFGPLRGKVQRRDRPARQPVASTGGRTRQRENGAVARPPAEREPMATTTTLRVRVPGENFALVEDEPSTTSSEAAIDIRTALTKYESGRREARDD